MKKIYTIMTALALIVGVSQLYNPLPASAITYTLAEVQAHNTASDCWTIVGGNVYNLTSYIASHPGGVGTISSICGVDGTAAFTAMHGSSAAAQAALASLLIGNLAVPDTTAPNMPTGLMASVISSSQINLSWTASTDNVGVTGYNIYRNGVLVGTSPTTAVSNTGLAASTTYSFAVAAFDAAGNVSSQTAAVSATTLPTSAPDTATPSIPTNLAASVISSSQINLSWTASTDNVGVAGYRIYRNGIQVATSTAASFANTGLTASTTYSFTVAAFDAAGNVSAQSATVSATTLPSAVVGKDEDEHEDEDEDEAEHEDEDEPDEAFDDRHDSDRNRGHERDHERSGDNRSNDGSRDGQNDN